VDLIKEIGPVIVSLGVLINAIIALLTYIKTMNTAETISVLEKNTNSIKDALVKVTGESEHAKGVLQGKAESK